MSVFEITSGRFDNIIIKINKDRGLDEQEMKHIKDHESKRATWIHIKEIQLKYHIDYLLDNQYKFHKHEKEYYIYYKWHDTTMKDMIPPYANSQTGVAVLLVSPDMKNILLVFEYGAYKPVTGMVDLGELAINAGIRESKEEVGIDVDINKPIKLCGIDNIANCINGSMFCYSMIARDNIIKVDGIEINEAKWFSISFLMNAHKYLLENGEIKADKPHSNFIEYDGYKINCWMLYFLNNYVNERFLNNHIVGNYNLIY